MALIWADVHDASGRVAVITQIESVEVARQLDTIGRFTLRCFVDRNTLALRSERVIYIYADGDSSRLIGAGVIRSLYRKANDSTILVAEGPLLTDELKRRNTLAGRTFATTLAAAASELIGLVPGWTVAVAADIADRPVQMRFDNVSVYQAFRQLSKRYGWHIRSTTPRQLNVGSFGDPSGANIQAVETVTYESLKSSTLLVEEFGSDSDSYEIVNRVYPFGAGEGRAAITLEHGLRDMPYAIQQVEAPDGSTAYYLEDAASIAAYGRIEAVVNFNEIRALDNSDTSLDLASEALYDAAVTYLQRYKEPFRAYSATVYQAGGLKVGDTIDVRYKAFIESDGLIPYIDVQGQFWILRATEIHTGSGVRTQLVIGNVDHQPASLAERMLAWFEDTRTRDFAPSVSTNTRSYAYIAEVERGLPAEVPLVFSTSVLNVYRLGLSMTTRGGGVLPSGISVFYRGVDVTRSLFGVGLIDTQGAPTTLVADSAALLTLIRKQLRGRHLLEVRCLRGSGSLDVVVDIYESSQAIEIGDIAGGVNLRPSAGLLGIVNLHAFGYATAVALDWTAAPSATRYKVRYKLSTATSWTNGAEVTTSSSWQPISGTVGASYDFQVQGIDQAGAAGPWSASVSATLAYQDFAPAAVTGITRVYATDYNALSTGTSTNVGMIFRFDEIEAEQVFVQVYGRASSTAAWALNSSATGTGNQITLTLNRAASSEFPYEWRLDFVARNRNSASSWASSAVSQFYFEFCPPSTPSTQAVEAYYYRRTIEPNWNNVDTTNFLDDKYPIQLNTLPPLNNVTLRRFRWVNNVTFEVEINHPSRDPRGLNVPFIFAFDGSTWRVNTQAHSSNTDATVTILSTYANGHPQLVRLRYSGTRPSSWNDGGVVSIGSPSDMFRYDGLSGYSIDDRVRAFIEAGDLSLETSGQGITNLAAAPGDGQAVISWTGITGISSYELQYAVAGEAGEIESAVSPYTLSLTNGETYEVTVRVPGGAWADIVEVRPGRVPDAPTGVVVSPRPGGLLVEWEAAYGHGLPVLDYTVSWSGGSQSGRVGQSYLITGLTNGQQYAVTVAARNERGTGTASPNTRGTPEALPAVPTGLSVVKGSSSADASWSAAARADKYEVQWTAGGAETANRFLHIDGLQSDMPVQVRVRSIGDSGVSAWTDWVTVTPVGGLLTPHNLQANTASFDWESVRGATWYRVRYKTLQASDWTTSGKLTSAQFSHSTRGEYMVQVQAGSDYAESLWSQTEFLFITGVLDYVTYNSERLTYNGEDVWYG